MSVGTSWFVQTGVIGATLQASVDTTQLGIVYLGYLIFTLFMTIVAAETNKVLFAIFVTIHFLFIGLALSSFGVMEHGMHLLTAYSELILALLSFYGAGANVLNKHFDFNSLPLGNFWHFHKRSIFKEGKNGKSIIINEA